MRGRGSFQSGAEFSLPKNFPQTNPPQQRKLLSAGTLQKRRRARGLINPTNVGSVADTPSPPTSHHLLLLRRSWRRASLVGVQPEACRRTCTLDYQATSATGIHTFQAGAPTVSCNPQPHLKCNITTFHGALPHSEVSARETPGP